MTTYATFPTAGDDSTAKVSAPTPCGAVVLAKNMAQTVNGGSAYNAGLTPTTGRIFPRSNR